MDGLNSSLWESDELDPALKGLFPQSGSNLESYFGRGYNSDQALEAVRSGASSRTGSLKFEGAGKTQRKIEKMGRKFSFMVEDSSAEDAATFFAPAFVDLLASEYPDVVCNPLKKGSMAAKIDYDNTYFDAFGMQAVQQKLVHCPQNFLVIPLMVENMGDLSNFLSGAKVVPLTSADELSNMKDYNDKKKAFETAQAEREEKINVAKSIFAASEDEQVARREAIDKARAIPVEPLSVGPVKKFAMFALVQLRGGSGGPSVEFFSPYMNLVGQDYLGYYITMALNQKLGTRTRAVPPKVCPQVNSSAPHTALWCILWTLYYFMLRVTNPEKTNDQLMEDIRGSVDVRYGSDNKSFLDFLQTYYDYYSRASQSKGKLQINKQLKVENYGLLNDQNIILLDYLIEKGPLGVLQGFLQLASSFPMCRCMAPETRDDPACFRLGEKSALQNRDQIIQKLRHLVKSDGCRDQRLFFFTYSVGEKEYSFIMYDKVYNMAYMLNASIVVGDKQKIKFGRGEIASDPDFQKTFAEIINPWNVNPILISDTAAVETVNEKETAVDEKDIWAPALNAIADRDYKDLGDAKALNVDRLFKSVTLFDYLFLFYKRITNPENTLFVIHRSVDKANISEVLSRIEFNSKLIYSLSTKTFAMFPGRKLNTKRDAPTFEVGGRRRRK